MELASFICLSVLSLGLGGVYTAFYKKVGWQGILVRGLTILSILALALVVANVKELNTALPIFLCLGLASLMLAETLFASNNVDTKHKDILFSIFYSICNLFLALSTLSLAQFNVFGLLGGLLLGSGVGLVVCAVKKYKDLYPIFTESVVYASIGLFLGFGLMSVLTSKHLISAIIMLVAGVLMLLQRMLYSFNKNDSLGYLVNFLYVLSLVLMGMSIYFY